MYSATQSNFLHQSFQLAYLYLVLMPNHAGNERKLCDALTVIKNELQQAY